MRSISLDLIVPGEFRRVPLGNGGEVGAIGAELRRETAREWERRPEACAGGKSYRFIEREYRYEHQIQV